MEGFAWEPEIVRMISGHHRTGEPLPAPIMERLRASRVFQGGMHMVRQLEFALFDLRVHAEYQPGTGARISGDPQGGPRRRGRGAAGGLRPLSPRLRPHLRWRLRGRLLQLQVGRGAVVRRLRRLRGAGRAQLGARPAAFASRSWRSAALATSARPSAPSAAARRTSARCCGTRGSRRRRRVRPAPGRRRPHENRHLERQLDPPAPRRT